ncbi:CPBP family intramembrane metalloprotease [Mycobacterium sp. OTB74]|jgi:membrane protease YdiL (CAAX protease family)|uniref:CPBP family intramembrane glutamic endopeptidase n=1 Tax=Mycobacterium sp. OTB74 TaxID=1853452 RepID=UPI00247711F6|nr:CPBP family intramembrane metalloprotease [Mycobacterium sp. OTB74]MDH6245402.1 membrane protease YdiL (CAAX protease family) [Mycobacterium sp. OTB74]
MTDPQQERRTLRIEVAIVLAVTFGLSAYTAVVSLAEAVILGLSGRKVALNERRSPIDLVDLALNLSPIFHLVAWGCLGLYLLWRSGFRPAAVGLGRLDPRRDMLGGLGLAALIGLPGLGLYFAGRALGIGVTVVPSTLGDTWWRIPVLVLMAFANAWAEEIIVVAYLQTRLRQLQFTPAKTMVFSALLRGSYHLYQGFGAGLGNVAMGLLFGYTWQRTGRLWPLIIAHGVIDAVAFVGYALAAQHLTWLH